MFHASLTRIKCTLKGGVTFHDGSALTLQDVKYTFERMFNPSTHATNYAGYLGIAGARDMLDGKATELAGITIQGDTHFTFTLTEPPGVFVSNLGVKQASFDQYKSDVAATKSSFYSSSEFDALVTRAHGNLPANQRADLYRQADQLLCRQDYATVPVLYPHYNYFACGYVRDIKVGNLALHLQDLDIQRKVDTSGGKRYRVRISTFSPTWDLLPGT